MTVARVRSRSSHPEPDPVVFVHGGPGASVLQYGIDRFVDLPLLARRDLVLFDQRGSGLSSPPLECPEREQAFLTVMGTALDFPEELRLFDAAITSCYERLRSEGRDLDRYNSQESAIDLVDLAAALGVDRWNVWAEGYGARVALAALRSHPDVIRSIVLDSAFPTEAVSADDQVAAARRSFDLLSEQCSQEPACEQRSPDLLQQLTTFTERLDATPMPYDVTDVDGRVLHLQLTGDVAMSGILNALQHTDLIPRIPRTIHDLSTGARTLPEIIDDFEVPFFDDASEGAALSYECADDADASSHAARPDGSGGIGLWLLLSPQMFCTDWPVAPAAAPDGATRPLPTVPMLLFAGEYDPTTAATTSQLAARSLPDAIYVEVPRGGHHPALDTPCTADVLTRFFDDGTDVDTSCVRALVATPFD